jgi:hypothetical protein
LLLESTGTKVMSRVSSPSVRVIVNTTKASLPHSSAILLVASFSTCIIVENDCKVLSSSDRFETKEQIARHGIAMDYVTINCFNGLLL